MKPLPLLVEWVRLWKKRPFFARNWRDLGWVMALAPDPAQAKLGRDTPEVSILVRQGGPSACGGVWLSLTEEQ